jgi:hypothetical protein
MSLQEIQSKLKAPKNQVNTFGGYKYRNQEDILEALKPLLAEYKYSLTITDSMEQVGDRVYVKACVRLFGEDGKLIAETAAWAREPESRKGMDASQLTGATSSYARKYALNGMFLIDDTRDADSMKPDQNGCISEKQLSQIKDFTDAMDLNMDKFLEYAEADSLETIPAKNFGKVIAMLEKKMEQAA